VEEQESASREVLFVPVWDLLLYADEIRSVAESGEVCPGVPIGPVAD